MSNRKDHESEGSLNKPPKKLKLQRLYEIIGEDHPSVNVVVQLEGKPTKRTVIFFKFNPSVIPMDLGRSLLKSASNMIHRTIDTAHMYEGMVNVTETEIDIQKRRYEHTSLFEKVAREDNCQEMWVGLDRTSGNVVAVGFLDPQVIKLSIDTPEFQELLEELGLDVLEVVEGKGIYVDPRYKRNKLGGRILEEIEYFAVNRLQRPLLFLSPYAGEAIMFYTSSGYRSLGMAYTEVEIGRTTVTFPFWAFVIPYDELVEKAGHPPDVVPPNKAEH